MQDLQPWLKPLRISSLFLTLTRKDNKLFLKLN